MKSLGKRSRFRFTARLSVLVWTPNNTARSLSRMIFCPRKKRMSVSTRAAGMRAFVEGMERKIAEIFAQGNYESAFIRLSDSNLRCQIGTSSIEFNENHFGPS